MAFSDIFFVFVVPIIAVVVAIIATNFLASSRALSQRKKLLGDIESQHIKIVELESTIEQVKDQNNNRGRLLERWQSRHGEPLADIREKLKLSPAFGFEDPVRKVTATDKKIIDEIDKEIVDLQEAGVPIQTELLMNLGIVTFAIGNIERSAELFSRLLLKDSTHRDARTNLGIILLKQRQYEQALTVFKESEELSSHRFEAHLGLGLAHIGLKDFNNAIEALSMAIRLRPEHARTYCELGHAYTLSGELERATESVKVALKLDPNLDEARHQQQKILIKMGKFDEAIAECHEYLKSRKSSLTYYNLASAFAFKGDKEKALNSLKEAIIINDETRFMAKDDSAFTFLKDSSSFKNLIEGKPGLF